MLSEGMGVGDYVRPRFNIKYTNTVPFQNMRKVEKMEQRTLHTIVVGTVKVETPGPDEGFAVPFTQGGRDSASINPLTSLLQRLNGMDNRRPIVVQAGTGTGKSIAIPTGLAGGGHRVLVACPTIRAAKDLNASVRVYCKNRYRVGYAADREIYYDAETQIVYATAGHVFLRQLGNPSYLSQFDYLLLDEFQKPGIEMAMIFELWKSLPSSGSQENRPMILLMSANELKAISNASVIVVDISPNFEVETRYYSSEFDRFLNGNSSVDGGENLYQSIATQIVDLNNTQPLGTRFLVFCPGHREIERVAESLSIKMDPSKYKVYRIVGGEAVDSGIYERASSQYREVVLATNAVETAVTIGDLSVVIDSMREKVPMYNDSGVLQIRTQWTTQNNAVQRGGRTGRVCVGLVLRMCSRQRFESIPRENPSPFKTTPLEKIYLLLLLNGYNPRTYLPEDAGVTQTTFSGIEKRLLQYKLLRAPRSNSNELMILTDEGKFTTHIPLNYTSGSFLIHWLVSGFSPFVGVVLASMMSTSGRELFIAEHKNTESPLIEYYNLARDYVELLIQVRRDTIIHASSKQYQDFCITHQVIPSKSFSEFTRILHDTCRFIRNTRPLTIGHLPEMSTQGLDLIIMVARTSGFEVVNSKLNLGSGLDIQIGAASKETYDPELVFNPEDLYYQGKDGDDERY